MAPHSYGCAAGGLPWLVAVGAQPVPESPPSIGNGNCLVWLPLGEMNSPELCSPLLVSFQPAAPRVSVTHHHRLLRTGQLLRAVYRHPAGEGGSK